MIKFKIPKNPPTLLEVTKHVGTRLEILSTRGGDQQVDPAGGQNQLSDINRGTAGTATCK